VIPTKKKKRRGARRKCVGPIKYKHNFLSRYIINIFLYQNKSAGIVTYSTFITRTEAFYGLWKSPYSVIRPFGTGRLVAKGQGAAMENEEGEVMGSCLFEHVADERWALELNFVISTARAALSGNYGNAGRAARKAFSAKSMSVATQLLL
jgi:hypothetical protein